MGFGFYIVMAAQFFSALADNALLIAAIAVLRAERFTRCVGCCLRFLQSRGGALAKLRQISVKLFNC